MWAAPFHNLGSRPNKKKTVSSVPVPSITLCFLTQGLWAQGNRLPGSCYHNLCNNKLWSQSVSQNKSFVRDSVIATRKVTNSPLKQGCHLFSHGYYSAREQVLLSQIPRKHLSFLFVCSVFMGAVLVNSNLLHGERFTLNRNAVMELLIYLSGPVLGYKETKDQDPYTKT